MNPNDSFALPKHGGHPLKDARKEAIFAELHSLLGSGLDFSRSFSLLIEGERDVQTKTLLSSLYRSVVRGEALARAFERSGRFAPLDCGVLRLGEQTGRLDEALAFLADYYRKRIAQRRMVSGAVSYPLIILFTAIVVVIFMVLVIVPKNPLAITNNNATRWLGIPGTSLQFQPSEIAKVAIVVYFAGSISRKKEQMQTFRYGIVPYAFILVLTAGLVGKEPHLSGALLILGAGAAMMLVGGIHWRWVGLAMGAAGLLLYLVLGVIGYNASRIEMWHNPWLDPQGAGYQLRQSLITIGSGGLWGVGLGKSRQKFLYLPEEHNDFIFAIVCEELGLIGATVIMLLFAALILRGFWIALHARDRFGSLMVVGVMTLVGLQTFLNIGVVTGLLPTTGISLPFFSYGGTALSIQLAEMGVILSVSRQMKPTKAG